MTAMSEIEGDIVALCDTCAVDEGEVLRVEPVGMPPLAVYRVDGEFFVTSDTCTHGDASLAEGFVENGAIECPWHNGKFCIRTGAALNFPATEPLRTWPVTLVGGKICISTGTTIPSESESESEPNQGTSCHAN